MSRVEGIAARAAQRAFFGDFDGKGGHGTGKDVGPCMDDFGLFHDLSKSKIAYATGLALADANDSEQSSMLGRWRWIRLGWGGYIGKVRSSRAARRRSARSN